MENNEKPKAAEAVEAAKATAAENWKRLKRKLVNTWRQQQPNSTS